MPAARVLTENNHSTILEQWNQKKSFKHWRPLRTRCGSKCFGRWSWPGRAVSRRASSRRRWASLRPRSHLKELAGSGLVTQERASRHLIYRAAYDNMNALLGYLTDNCCQGAACAVETAADACKC